MIEDLWIRGNRELTRWHDAPVSALIAHVVDCYHLETRMELGRLETLAEEAVLFTGGEEPALVTIRNELARFSRECRAHMLVEEQKLFPYLLAREADPVKDSGDSLVEPLMKLLEDEHQAEKDLFRRLRGLAAEWPDHPGATGLRERLRTSLATLERSLHGHILLESQILFRH